MNKLILPWHSHYKPELTGNGRLHHYEKAAITKRVKQAAFDVALAARLHLVAPFPKDARIGLMVQYYPPNNIRRDRDNIIASLKPTFDGIAYAMHVDDSQFAPQFFNMKADKLSPRFEIEIVVMPDDAELYRIITAAIKPLQPQVEARGAA